MAYHIDTGLIKEKFKVNCECPICEIQAVNEEQFVHEFLNDAVMEDGMRAKVNKFGFCSRHYDMLLARQNKLSVALQVSTRLDTLMKKIDTISSVKAANKQADFIEKASKTCIICNLSEESMDKYYRTIAEMYKREPSFRSLFASSKGFCFHHYARLLRFAKYAGSAASEYVAALSYLQQTNLERISDNLETFCVKHDYRNALEPLGEAETALPRARIKFYGRRFK